jgi:hypothetical protein
MSNSEAQTILATIQKEDEEKKLLTTLIGPPYRAKEITSLTLYGSLNMLCARHQQIGQ